MAKTSVDRELSRAERELMRAKARVTRLRRRLPRTVVQDYSLTGAGGRRVKLSALFGRHRDVILIHNMGRTCPYCTTWADGFNGVLKHLESRAAFVVVSPDPPAAQARFARSRGWKFRMVSSRGTSLAEDLGFRSADGRYRPGVSVLRKERTGAIVRVSKARFGPWDEFCSVFNLFDLLPEGADDWRPRFTYR